MLRFKSWMAVAVLAALGACAASPALAANQIMIVDSTAPTNAVTINPGGSFTLSVVLTADVPYLGFSAYLDDLSYTNTTHFTITNRTRSATNPFTNADDETTPSSPDFMSDPLNGASDNPGGLSEDLGYTRGLSPVAAGKLTMMTLRITLATNLAAGPYSLGFDASSVLVDGNFNPVYFNSGAPIYTVTVVAPEPAMSSVLLVSLIGVAALRRRRPRASTLIACG